MANAVEKFAPGDKLTFTADGAVTGGTLVGVSGARTAATAADQSVVVVGVAQYDAADTELVSVATEGVWMLTANGSIAAGATVVCAAAGEVKTNAGTGTVVGIALEAIADNATGPIKLRL